LTTKLWFIFDFSNLHKHKLSLIFSDVILLVMFYIVVTFYNHFENIKFHSLTTMSKKRYVT